MFASASLIALFAVILIAWTPWGRARLQWSTRLPIIRLMHVVMGVAAIFKRWRDKEPPTVAFMENSAVEHARIRTGRVAESNSVAFGGDTFHKQVLEAVRGDLHTFSMIDGWVFAWNMQLGRKLEVFRTLAEHPEILGVELRPVWIVGWPRTGSTFLHSLMGLDATARCPQAWELRYPTPPPEPSSYESNPQRQLAATFLTNIYKIFPKLKGIHYIRAEDPDECVEGFMDCAFPQRYLWGAHDDPNAYAWYMNADTTPQYRNYRRLLQILCWKMRINSHLVLKSPHHTVKLSDIAKVFPGSRFLWLHRDPRDVIGSTCSMNMTVSDYFTSWFTHKHTMGQRTFQRMGAALQQGLEQREQLERAGFTFVDVKYSELKADPVATLKNAYKELGLYFSEAFEEKIKEFMAERAAKGRGKLHSYTLEEYGLTEEQLQGEFESYVTRFLS